VVDDLGNPVGGVTIQLYDEALGYFYANTAPDGTFTIYAKDGSYRLQLSTNGSVPGDVPSGEWTLQTVEQAFTVNGNTNIGDIALWGSEIGFCCPPQSRILAPAEGTMTDGGDPRGYNRNSTQSGEQ
jgi:hypothetical protein